MGGLVSVPAVLVRHPAERARVGHFNGERLPAAGHRGAVEWRTPPDALDRTHQVVLGNRVEVSRQVLEAGQSHGRSRGKVPNSWGRGAKATAFADLSFMKV